jgi:hypothetical protein
MAALRDITGQRFGRTVALEVSHSTKLGEAIWKCVCDCGTNHLAIGRNLRKLHTTSCGCYQREKARSDGTTHGGTYTRLYRIWCAMKARCSNPNATYYCYYGGRGISVCEEWTNDFSAFQSWALANGYQDDLSIDRIDNDKGYSPDNCRWADRLTQNRNRRPRKARI